MRELISIKLYGKIPLVAAAIHNGHRLSENVSGHCTLNASDRLREKDPFTGIWTDITDNQIITRYSRFEFDLIRPPENAIYLMPSDA